MRKRRWYHLVQQWWREGESEASFPQEVFDRYGASVKQVDVYVRKLYLKDVVSQYRNIRREQLLEKYPWVIHPRWNR